MAENPVLTSKEPDVDVVIFGNTFEIEESTNAQVDKALNISLISKAMIKRLRADPKPCHQGTLKDSTGKTYQPIGKVDLLWHRVTALRSNEQTFFVVDLSGPDVIFGADAITSEDPSNIHTLGLDNQNAAKKIQDSKKQIELAKRAEEKKKQEQREKEKQGQSKSSSSR